MAAPSTARLQMPHIESACFPLRPNTGFLRFWQSQIAWLPRSKWRPDRKAASETVQRSSASLYDIDLTLLISSIDRSTSTTTRQATEPTYGTFRIGSATIAQQLKRGPRLLALFEAASSREVLSPLVLFAKATMRTAAFRYELEDSLLDVPLTMLAPTGRYGIGPNSMAHLEHRHPFDAEEFASFDRLRGTLFAPSSFGVETVTCLTESSGAWRVFRARHADRPAFFLFLFEILNRVIVDPCATSLHGWWSEDLHRYLGADPKAL